MADSDSSDLSSHDEKEIQKLYPIFAKSKAATKTAFPPPQASPPRPKREPSPPHEDVLADDPAIAQIVTFRARFSEAMGGKLQNLGPQDVERGVVDSSPSPQVEGLLCALLGLVLNRKKPVERGHHGRALEEAVLSHKSQWPFKWRGVNPLHGGKSFENMTPQERLDLLRTLIMWSLTSSEAIQAILKEKYKQQRHNDDENQPLSVQPWGVDGDKRRYFLIQGLDDTGFRVYREGSRFTKNAHWYSMAGEIEEVKALATKLEDVDRSQAGRRLAGKIMAAVPTFEATEEKRHRREYRQMRRAAFSRPEPGFSLYEGRTRGKRMRYTYDDGDDFDESDATSVRRSARHSARNTPFDSGPTVTASGRQVRQPRTGDYGESLLSGAPTNADDLGPENSEAAARSGTEDSDQPVTRGGRAMRSAARPALNGLDGSRKRKHIDTYNGIDEWSDEEEADDWDSEKNESEDERMPDADDEEDAMSEADEESEDEDDEPRQLVVRLKIPTKVLSILQTPGIATPAENGAVTPAEDEAQAGAPKCDQPSVSTAVEEKVEAAQAQQQWSSPTGPSAYPTPTSSSFLPPDTKMALAPLPAITEQTQPSSLPVQNGEPVFVATKPETAPIEPALEPEAKPALFAQAPTNGALGGYENESTQS